MYVDDNESCRSCVGGEVYGQLRPYNVYGPWAMRDAIAASICVSANPRSSGSARLDKATKRALAKDFSIIFRLLRNGRF